MRRLDGLDGLAAVAIARGRGEVRVEVEVDVEVDVEVSPESAGDCWGTAGGSARWTAGELGTFIG